MAAYALAWSLAWIAAATVRIKHAFVYPVIGLILLVLFRDQPPALRLLASSLLFLYLMKAAVLAKREPELKPLDRAIYFTLWPGMDPERLAQRKPPEKGTGQRFGRGLTLTICGPIATVLIAIFQPNLSEEATCWLGIAALILTVHFGFSEILTSLLRLANRPVKPLFDNPLAARTLSDFWTKRWNLAYVEMNRRLFMPALTKRLGLKPAVFATFLISGLLHEMAISYPAGQGYGLPLAYFAIQGVGVLIERRAKLRSRIFAWLVISAPLPLLFHAPFRETLILPLFANLHHLLTAKPLAWYVGLLIYAVGVMQLTVLLASAQVPKRLNWKEDLPKLSPFNQKLMWTYGWFIVATITGMAILTLALHQQFLIGNPATTGIAIFTCFFWCLRLAIDTWYYKSEDWPPGETLKTGHALLNALFIFLATTYATLALWGLSRRPI